LEWIETGGLAVGDRMTGGGKSWLH
jgi:hypothetical protein